MKYLKLVAVILMLGMACWAENVVLEEMSLKAGPTAPGEKPSFLWLETFVFPKTVKPGGFLTAGVRLTSKAKGVRVNLDFAGTELPLNSADGLSWDLAYPISSEISSGLHAAKFVIEGAKGSLQRRLEFFVKKDDGQTVLVEKESGWQLTLAATTTVSANGKSYVLRKGDKIAASSRAPFYKVTFPDGSFSWVPAEQVEDPSVEYYFLGYEAYKMKNYHLAVSHYKKAIELDPELARAHFWLAKSYYGLEEWDACYLGLKQLFRLDPRSLEGRILSAGLAQKLFTAGQIFLRNGKFSEAIQAYQKVIDLKSESAASWGQLSFAYRSLGFESEADAAKKEAEKLDAAAPALAVAKKEEITLDESGSIQIVKGSLTRKGTNVDGALRSVLSLTKSLGNSIKDLGWRVEKRNSGFVVSYLCELGEGKKETFQWLVSSNTRVASAHNQNAQLLTERW